MFGGMPRCLLLAIQHETSMLNISSDCAATPQAGHQLQGRNPQLEGGGGCVQPASSSVVVMAVCGVSLRPILRRHTRTDTADDQATAPTPQLQPRPQDRCFTPTTLSSPMSEASIDRLTCQTTRATGDT